MTTDSERLNIEFLKEPGTVTYEFAAYLSANRIGHGTSLGFYKKAELEEAMEEFGRSEDTNAEEMEQLKSWIESFPWDANARMAFSLIW